MWCPARPPCPPLGGGHCQGVSFSGKEGLCSLQGVLFSCGMCQRREILGFWAIFRVVPMRRHGLRVKIAWMAVSVRFSGIPAVFPPSRPVAGCPSRRNSGVCEPFWRSPRGSGRGRLPERREMPFPRVSDSMISSLTLHGGVLHVLPDIHPALHSGSSPFSGRSPSPPPLRGRSARLPRSAPVASGSIRSVRGANRGGGCPEGAARPNPSSCRDFAVARRISTLNSSSGLPCPILDAT